MIRFAGCPYPIHPLAMDLPPLVPERYARLLASITANGLWDPIVVWQGQIIDGVHRLKACLEAGIEPRYEFLDDDANPYEYIADENFDNRDMAQNQRAQAGYLMCQNSTPGRPRTPDENSAHLRSLSQAEAAKLVGVSPRLISHASRVLSEESTATPALRRAVRGWRIRCSDASRVVDRPPAVQDRAVALVNSGKVKTIKRAVQQVEREIAQAEEAAALADVLAKPPDATITLHTATVTDLRDLVKAGSVDAIITHPPSTHDAMSILPSLADFAANALRDTGMMVVVGYGVLLPMMLQQLEHPDLRWLAECDLLLRGPAESSGPPHHVALHRRPLLVYGKQGFRLQGMDDLIEVPSADELPPGLHRNGVAISLVIERFCKPGQAVCDPVMRGRASTALAARKLGCTFVGASETQSEVEAIRVRLARAGDRPAGDADAEGQAIPPPVVGTPSRI